MLIHLVVTSREELVLEGLFPLLVPYPLKYEVVIVVACVTLRLSLINGVHVGHQQ